MDCKLAGYVPNGVENTDVGRLPPKVDHSSRSIGHLTLHTNDDQIPSSNTKQSKNAYSMDVDTVGTREVFARPPVSISSAQSSSAVVRNRKRRSRTSREMPQMNSSTFVATTSLNGAMRRKSDLSCVVCRGLAHGYNFDAISCESCKAFFRRNALFHPDRLKCRRDGVCDITLETRRRCKSCRLKKCFAVGMRKEWILTDEEKVNKKRRIEENRRLRVSTTDDAIANKSEGKTSRRKPPSHSDHIVGHVVMAFRDGFKLEPTGYGWSYPLARKITALCQILNTKNTTALRLISSYKRLDDFDALDETDKVHLVKSNLRYMFFFQSSLGYDPINDVYHEENSTQDKPVYGADIREIYGDDIHSRCTLIIRALHALAQIDERIIHLALVVFLFSNGLSSLVNRHEQSLNNHLQVHRIQNVYAEQLWLLLERHYGSVRAVFIYSTLIHQCLLIQGLLGDIQQDVHEKLGLCHVSPIIRSVMDLS